ncbi:hypothetical protein Amet_3900 [Alkaliphilus metalliredigens QYMF]|uniref:Uncharacterized protein n=1 Tax=Alkaliphilus metalliredigens (strain QYMF) TaxID=293826 RepID=A6TUX9_ALKMQ|nr:hypothetical protein [Alkaliphilus metalliredigens]ABR49997.1 hypothetical protein Amet_3900 [Alkaliphilus metalliredigens QYMF]
MNRSKKILSVFIAMTLMITGFALVANAGSPTLDEKTLDVKFRQIIEMPELDGDDSELLEQAIEAAVATGWFYNSAEQRFERLVTYTDIEVTIDGADIELDSHGQAKVLTQTNKSLEVKVYDPVTNESYAQLISGDTTEATVIFDVDISYMISVDNKSMENLEKSDFTINASPTDPYWSNGEQGVYGYRLHCNRFNGYLGNGTYYSNQASPSAILNFFASDCDWALGSYSNCLADYTSNPFCAASPQSKQASCSGLIGHYGRFHMHTTYTGN